jgi:hypothetical protein
VSDRELGAPDESFDTENFDGDERLRALLRGGDPAGSLPPADPAGLSRLLEDIMSADLDVRPAAPDAAVPHRRTRATWLVAAAAVAAIAAGGAFAVAGLTGGDAGAPQADQPAASTIPSTSDQTNGKTDANTPVAGQTTELTVAANGRCVAEPTAEMLAQYDQAFEGTVTSVEGDTITLDTTAVYQGQVGETVTVTAPPNTLEARANPIHFEPGGTYLLSAYQGSVSMCGFSGAATQELQSLYQKAFVH